MNEETFKPTLSQPTPQGANFQKNTKKINNQMGVKLNETDGLLSEAEQSLKKKIFSLAKMEALVFSDPKLSAKYEEMAENGEEKYGYHYNETIQNILFNDYVLNSPKYLQKYKQAVPKEKKRRDASGINQLKKAGEETMQHKTDIKPQKLAASGLKPVVAEDQEPLTRVEFLVNEKDPNDPDLFAYFPDEIHHGDFRTAYSHVGQHSSAHPQYAKESRPASPEEYAPLKAELESLGYNLEVVNGVNEETGSGSSGAFAPALGMQKREIAEMTGTGGGSGTVGGAGASGNGESGSGAYYTPSAWGSGDLMHAKGKAKVKTEPMVKGGTIIQESNYLVETDGFEKYINMLNEDAENFNKQLGQNYKQTHSESNQGLGVSELPQNPERTNKIKEIEDNTMLFLGQDIQHSPDADVEIFHQDMTEPHTLIPHQDNKIPEMQADGIASKLPKTPVGTWDKIDMTGRKAANDEMVNKTSAFTSDTIKNWDDADAETEMDTLKTGDPDKPNLQAMEESKQIQEKSVSKSQQKFMGMVHAVQKGELPKSDVGGKVAKAADTMKEKDAEDFASTKHKGLPEKVDETESTMIADSPNSMSNKMTPTTPISPNGNVPTGLQNTGGSGAMNESDMKLLEELDNELNAYSVHHKKLMKMSEDKKPSSLIMKDRLGDENKANFKKDFNNSDTKEIIDVEKELEWKDQQTDVPEDPQKLGAEIENTEVKATDAKSGEALKNVGDSANFKGDEIPKRNLTTKEQEEVNMYRNGQHSLVYDNQPNEAFEKRMKADMGDDIYEMRQKQLEFKGKAPMYNKVAQPIQDTKAERSEFDKEKSGWNEREGLKEGMVTGKFFNALGKRAIIDFNLNEVVEIKEATPALYEVSLEGLGNTYTQKVNVNESAVKAMNENKFFTDGKKVFAMKNPVQKLNENEQKGKKSPINEQFEKMKHLTGYNTKDFINTKGIKL
jgi:hypothetical protein